MFLRILSGLLCVLGIGAQDPIGTTGCSAPACVFANENLRFGTGLENSVNAQGLFVQPWYYSRTASAWYKLTFNNYPLDTAIGVGNTSSHWSKTTIVDLYSLMPSESFTNYSDFVVDSSDTTKSVGHGKIVATRNLNLLGQPIIFQNTFSLGLNDSFVKIVTQVINNSSAILNNLIIWTGTRDDFVGMTDVNTKTRGNLDTGNFTAVTANNQSSRAIMITNANEGVLFYSETAGVMTSYALCCSFSNAYNVNPLSLAPMTPSPTDGSYAAVLPLGDIAIGSSGSITWYYAAGAVTSLTAVAQSVAAAQVADASPSLSATGTPTGTPTGTNTSTNTGTPTGTSTPTGTPTGTNTSTPTPSSTTTAAATRSQTALPAPAPVPPTEILLRVQPNNDPSFSNMTYLYIFIPLNIIFCLCCSVGVILAILYKRQQRDEITIVKEVVEGSAAT